MRPLRYSINVTLDGCCDHMAVEADETIHRHATGMIAQADALLFGRVTYQMMEAAWRSSNVSPDMPEWMRPFAETIDETKKYVVSSTLETVDWNSELIRGDLRSAVEELKQQPGSGVYVGGVTLPTALAGMGLIDEYDFLVHSKLVGHGPTLFAGLSQPLDLTLVDRVEFDSGAVSMKYVPKR